MDTEADISETGEVGEAETTEGEEAEDGEVQETEAPNTGESAGPVTDGNFMAPVEMDENLKNQLAEEMLEENEMDTFSVHNHVCLSHIVRGRKPNVLRPSQPL